MGDCAWYYSLDPSSKFKWMGRAAVLSTGRAHTNPKLMAFLMDRYTRHWLIISHINNILFAFIATLHCSMHKAYINVAKFAFSAIKLLCERWHTHRIGHLNMVHMFFWYVNFERSVMTSCMEVLPSQLSFWNVIFLPYVRYCFIPRDWHKTSREVVAIIWICKSK